MQQFADPRGAEARELTSLLAELHTQLESVAHLERLKTYAIAARDLDSIVEITQREEDANLELAELERQRHALVRDFYAEGEIEPTIQQLARTLGGLEGESLSIAGESLRSAIADLRDVTRRNEGLLTWATDLARSTVQWLLGYGQVAPTYRRSGDREREPQLSARDWRA